MAVILTIIFALSLIEIFEAQQFVASPQQPLQFVAGPSNDQDPSNGQFVADPSNTQDFQQQQPFIGDRQGYQTDNDNQQQPESYGWDSAVQQKVF